MNLKTLKTPALVFMAGYGFFYVDHFHKAILNHGYHLALVAGAVYVVLMINAKASARNEEQEKTISEILNRKPMIQQQAVEESHTINLGQPQKAKA